MSPDNAERVGALRPGDDRLGVAIPPPVPALDVDVRGLPRELLPAVLGRKRCEPGRSDILRRRATFVDQGMGPTCFERGEVPWVQIPYSDEKGRLFCWARTLAWMGATSTATSLFGAFLWPIPAKELFDRFDESCAVWPRRLSSLLLALYTLGGVMPGSLRGGHARDGSLSDGRRNRLTIAIGATGSNIPAARGHRDRDPRDGKRSVGLMLPGRRRLAHTGGFASHARGGSAHLVYRFLPRALLGALCAIARRTR
ncbi:hypothetical protein ACHAWF_017208 [Thalassiosira exigua]